MRVGVDLLWSLKGRIGVRGRGVSLFDSILYETLGKGFVHHDCTGGVGYWKRPG
jgi:hypothetical protein